MRRLTIILLAVTAMLPLASAPRAHAQATTFGDGTYVVGTDIQAGTYQTQGGAGCYWARLSGLDGTDDEIIYSTYATSSSVVQIKPTDVAFESINCGAWLAYGATAAGQSNGSTSSAAAPSSTSATLQSSPGTSGTMSVQDYYSAHDSIASAVNYSLADIPSLQYASDQYTPIWRQSFQNDISVLQGAYTAARSLQPPPCLASFHQLWVNSLNLYVQAYNDEYASSANVTLPIDPSRVFSQINTNLALKGGKEKGQADSLNDQANQTLNVVAC